MHKRSGRHHGFSLIEIMIVVAIILIIAAMAVPPLQESLKLARETSAVSAVRALHVAQVQYYSQFNRFALSLGELGPPASGGAGPTAAFLIPDELASGAKGGYRFQMQGTAEGYVVSAVPLVFNTTGRRSFYSDQTQVIRHNWGAEPATADSKEISK